MRPSTIEEGKSSLRRPVSSSHLTGLVAQRGDLSVTDPRWIPTIVTASNLHLGEILYIIDRQMVPTCQVTSPGGLLSWVLGYEHRFTNQQA